jgi:hypothetical protein
MIRTRAKVGDMIRVLVPNVDTMMHLPPGTRLAVVAYVPDQPASCLVEVVDMEQQILDYHIVVPVGAKVHVHEE